MRQGTSTVRWEVPYETKLVEAFYVGGAILGKTNTLSHHGILSRRQLQEVQNHRSWGYLQLMRVRDPHIQHFSRTI